jgi:hypothetical protein
MSAHLRARGRHRKPRPERNHVRTAVAVGGLTASVVVGTDLLVPGALAAASAASADDFARLRASESGGNYATNTGNGYYGAYQFDLQTWRGLGYSGLPSDASPATQDEAARRLQADRGWSPWPSCSRQLGLIDEPSSASPTTVTAVSTTTAPVVHGPGPYRGVTLSTRLHAEKRSDVRALQRQLLTAGYVVSVDGHFGKQTEHAVRRFQHDAGITSDGLAGPATFARLF